MFRSLKKTLSPNREITKEFALLASLIPPCITFNVCETLPWLTSSQQEQKNVLQRKNQPPTLSHFHFSTAGLRSILNCPEKCKWTRITWSGTNCDKTFEINEPSETHSPKISISEKKTCFAHKMIWNMECVIPFRCSTDWIRSFEIDFWIKLRTFFEARSLIRWFQRALGTHCFLIFLEFFVSNIPCCNLRSSQRLPWAVDQSAV